MELQSWTQLSMRAHNLTEYVCIPKKKILHIFCLNGNKIMLYALLSDLLFVLKIMSLGFLSMMLHVAENHSFLHLHYVLKYTTIYFSALAIFHNF